jgi:negative regulator of sigma E activity
MRITDEKLSAFLDAELPPEDMENIREALETDDDLVMRLAELSQVDQWVLENAQQIDATPVPDKLVQLAQQIDAGRGEKEEKQPNIVQLSKWQAAKSMLNMPMSLAASVVLAVTVGVSTMNYQGGETFSNEIANVLDSSISGEIKLISEETSVKAQLSFANQEGDLCRQYLLTEKQGKSTNIACKENNRWRLHATTKSNDVNTQSYQTASSNQQLDQVIDDMIVGSPLNREQEQNAIVKQWQSK